VIPSSGISQSPEELGSGISVCMELCRTVGESFFVKLLCQENKKRRIRQSIRITAKIEPMIDKRLVFFFAVFVVTGGPVAGEVVLVAHL